MAFSWGALLEGAITVGTGIYDYLQDDEAAETARSASISGVVDPFGADERQKYQDKQTQLYNDPSYLQNLPGYKFQQEMGEQAINRQSAKTGHYISTNRLHDVSKFNQGLAETSYNQEANRLMQLSGANFAPSASAYADLQTTGISSDQATGQDIGKSLGGLSKILEGFGINFSSGSDGESGGAITDIMKGMGIELPEGMMEELEGVDFGSAIERIANGEDPKEVMKDTVIDYAKDKGTDWVKEKGQELWNEYFPDEPMSNETVAQMGGEMPGEGGLQEPGGPGGGPGIASEADAIPGTTMPGMTSDPLSSQNFYGGDVAGSGGELTPSFSDAGADSLYGDAPGPSMGGATGAATEAGTGLGTSLEQSYAGYQEMVSGGTPMGTAGGVAGGLAGSYLGSQIPGIGTDTPLGGYLGGVAGTAAGAYVGAMAGGASVAAGSAAGAAGVAGASAAGAAAMAAAGPAAIAGAVLIIGQGLYGVVQTNRKKEEKRDSTRRSYGEWWGDVRGGGSRVSDPTGGGLGMGYDTMLDGHRFFIPEKFHKMALDKANYGTDPNIRHHSDLQGNYGSYYNPMTGEWQEGSFANFSTTGDSTHDWVMGAQTWSPLSGRKPMADRPGGFGGWGGFGGAQYGQSYAELGDAQRAGSARILEEEREVKAMNAAIDQDKGWTAADAQKHMGTITRTMGRNTSGEESGQSIWMGGVNVGSYTGAGGAFVPTDFNAEQKDVSCFTASTLVRMADGSTKPISMVKPGDVVKGLHGDAPVIGMERVGLQGRNLFGFLHIPDVVWFTAEHPFLSERGWVALEPNGLDTKGWGTHRMNRKELNEIMEATDELLTEGDNFTVDGIVEQLAPEQTLYNLMLGDGNQVYYVGQTEDLMFAVKH